jgi:hypothetical protein
MATIRAYTTIEQSRKLAEILPLESADMMWTYDFTVNDINGINVISNTLKLEEKDVPAWSLAALLSVLPAECECMSLEHINYGNNHKKYFMSYIGGENTDTYDNPVDACVDMILKLHELNLI